MKMALRDATGFESRGVRKRQNREITGLVFLFSIILDRFQSFMLLHILVC